jgi:hypothetical protein
MRCAWARILECWASSTAAESCAKEGFGGGNFGDSCGWAYSWVPRHSFLVVGGSEFDHGSDFDQFSA